MSLVESLGSVADRLVERARRRGADVAEATVRAGRRLHARVRLGQTELLEQAESRSAGLRVMLGQRVAVAFSNDLGDAGLERLVDDALELARLAEPDEHAGPPDPALLARETDDAALDPFDPGVEALEADLVVEQARAAEAAALSYDARITNSEGARCSASLGYGVLVTSGGFRGLLRGTHVSLSALPVVLDEGGKRRRGRHWTAGRHRSMLEAPDAVGRKAAADALRRLGARKIATCECPVIFDPEAGRDLLELFASCVLGSAIWRRGSYLVDRLGTEVASPCVTLVDDPLRPRAPGSRPFDGEGLPSRRNVVVERGVLRSYLLDVYAARKLGMQSTASAARSPSAGVGPATSNFILEPGERTRDELVREVRAGLLVSETMGFGFNPVTGDFSRGASGYWIENGAIAYPVSEVTLSLRFDELWRRVDAVADDLDTRAATACPTFRVSRMMVAGTG